MPPMVADDQHADQVIAYDAEQDGVRKTMHETTPYSVRDNCELQWTCANLFDGRMNFKAERIAEPSALQVVIRHGVIEIGYSVRVKLKPHSRVPSVRRRNSAWPIV